MVSLPQNLKLQYSSPAITEACSTLGRDIAGWSQSVFSKYGEQVLAVPVLRGAIFFFADLMRNIENSVEIAPARAWAYESDQTQKSALEFHFDEAQVKGRSVLLVDDVCDSGRTLSKLCDAVKSAGAREVRSAVIVKRIMDQSTFEPDWVGFRYQGMEWFVGYGMDDNEKWRNLPAIYLILKQ